MTYDLTPLTEEERVRISEGPATPLAMFLEVWEVILARFGSSIDEETEVDPTQYHLSYEDSQWCIQRIMECEEHPYRKADWALARGGGEGEGAGGSDGAGRGKSWMN